jgi:hypothetical protein
MSLGRCRKGHSRHPPNSAEIPLDVIATKGDQPIIALIIRNTNRVSRYYNVIRSQPQCACAQVAE